MRTGSIEVLKIFFSMLSIYELVALRNDAIRLNDKVCKELIDEEIKKRDKK